MSQWRAAELPQCRWYDRHHFDRRAVKEDCHMLQAEAVNDGALGQLPYAVPLVLCAALVAVAENLLLCACQCKPVSYEWV